VAGGGARYHKSITEWPEEDRDTRIKTTSIPSDKKKRGGKGEEGRGGKRLSLRGGIKERRKWQSATGLSEKKKTRMKRGDNARERELCPSPRHGHNVCCFKKNQVA